MISHDITFCLFHFHSRTSCPPLPSKKKFFLFSFYNFFFTFFTFFTFFYFFLLFFNFFFTFFYFFFTFLRVWPGDPRERNEKYQNMISCDIM